MKWSNVQLIFLREVRDQLRDRRTLFTIAVLPIFLYPLLGMIFIQVSQFTRQYPAKIRIIGAEYLPESPRLLDGDRFSAKLFDYADESNLLEIFDGRFNDRDHDTFSAAVEQSVRAGEWDAVLIIPTNFGGLLADFRSKLSEISRPRDAPTEHVFEEIPVPKIVYDQTRDKSRVARDRLSRVLRLWREKVGRTYLTESQIPVTISRPFELEETDVAVESKKRAALWSKVLPFFVLIWALTGAFYPAIDLCAGEKERGTLETLLSSPAQRREIVWGKLLTITLFSMVTALLNLVSMGLTAAMMLQQALVIQHLVGELPLGLPPLLSLTWLLIALIPVSALFSALSLALAALARSAKEGQYYLMPLLMVTMPLMILPSLPSIQLDPGTCLIPVTGLILLLRALMESDYRSAVIYVLPVLSITGACCLLAVRWAVDQFNNESVLFSESERFNAKAWLKHMIRNRGNTPTVGQAVFCALFILLLRFFASFQFTLPKDWTGMATMTVLTQITFFAVPALLLSLLLTRQPRDTLLLRLPCWPSLPAAMLLALLLHPASITLGIFVQHTYPLPEQIETISRTLVSGAPSLWMLIMVVAVTPAVCEELAFRGFILSGLRHLGHRWWAIVLTSIFFGIAHGVVQQSFTATIIGIFIGYLAVQSGSIFVCILFHVTHNSLPVVLPTFLEKHVGPLSGSHWLLAGDEADIIYRWPVVVITFVMALAVLLWFRHLPRQHYAEEQLQEALSNQAARATN